MAKKSGRTPPMKRKCFYCGHETTCSARQPYAESTPHEARWPHSPVEQEVPPLCAIETQRLVALRLLEEWGKDEPDLQGGTGI